MEAASGNDEEKCAHKAEDEAIGPEMGPGGATENDAASNVDEVGGGNKVAEGVEEFGHGFAREDVAREKDAGENGEEGELHGVGLGSGFAGNEDAEGERNENVGKRETGQKQDAAMNGDEKEEAHGDENHRELEETDGEIRKKFAEKQAHGANGSDEKLLESAAFFLADDGEGGEEGGDVEEEDGGESGKKEVGRTRVGIEKDFGAHVDGKDGVGTGEDTAEGFVEADSGGDVNGLARDGGIGAVDEDENLCAHLMEELVRVIDGNFDADAAFAGNDGVIQVFVIVDEADEVEGVGISEAIEEFAALAAAVGIVNDSVDLADVGVDAVAEKKHLKNGNDEGEEEGSEVAADVEGFLIEDGSETAEGVNHGRSPARLDACG